MIIQQFPQPQPMDFPRDYHWKRRGNAPLLNYFSKPPLPPAPHPSSQPPSKGRVRIEEYEYCEQNMLGSGYSSKVYLGCQSEDVRRQVAIKVVDKRRVGRERENLQLVKQEMAIHQQLDHPNIVKCHQVIERKDHYYIVLEYCPQGTLDAFIRKHERLTESTTVAIMEQVLAAYRYLLERRVLHRDLKPPNILKAGNNWKICDFGFSVMGKKNLVGEINVGTPAYMAPESLERTYYSPKTDFFSLGVVCYEMLLGTAPWQHKSEAALLALMQKGVPQERLAALANRNLAEFILRCCEPVERKRMSPQEFAEFSFWKEYETPRVTTCTQLDLPSQPPSRPSSKTLSSLRDLTLASNLPSTVSSVRGRKEPLEQLFQGNRAVIERELFICQILIALLRNHSLLAQQEAEKDLYLTLLSKHAGYILRRVKHQKLNYLCLKRWEEYLQSEDYQSLLLQAGGLQERVEGLVRAEGRRKSIVTIRVVNQKYDELTYDKHLSPKCVASLKEFILATIANYLHLHQHLTTPQLALAPQVTQTLQYLCRYYTYLKGLGIACEESRALALSQDYRLREGVREDFGKSELPPSEFWRLREEIESQLP